MRGHSCKPAQRQRQMRTQQGPRQTEVADHWQVITWPHSAVRMRRCQRCALCVSTHQLPEIDRVKLKLSWQRSKLRAINLERFDHELVGIVLKVGGIMYCTPCCQCFR